jgi:hypothetical protein
MVLTIIPQVITSLEKWAPAMYGCIVLLMAVYRPAGFLPKNQLLKLFASKKNPSSQAQRPPVATDA